MALTLSLTKDTDSASKLSLDLRKQEPFRVTLSWEGNSDLDLHAFHCVNTGSKATVSSFDDVLSTYNVRRKVRGQDVGHLPKNPDGSFQIHGGALRHSPDATDGDKADIDEYITVDTSLLNPPAQNRRHEINAILARSQAGIPNFFLQPIGVADLAHDFDSLLSQLIADNAAAIDRLRLHALHGQMGHADNAERNDQQNRHDFNDAESGAKLIDCARGLKHKKIKNSKINDAKSAILASLTPLSLPSTAAAGN
jgi:hypothetical protein